MMPLPSGLPIIVTVTVSALPQGWRETVTVTHCVSAVRFPTVYGPFPLV